MYLKEKLTNIPLIFFITMNINEDIIDLICEHIDYTEYAKTASICKRFAENIRNIPTNSKYKIIYNNSTNNDFILFYLKHKAKKYNYKFTLNKVLYTRRALDLYWYNFNSYKNLKCPIVLCDFLDISLNALNRNYAQIANFIKNINNRYNNVPITFESFGTIMSFLISQQIITDKTILNIYLCGNITTVLYKLCIVLIIFEFNRECYNRNILDNNKIQLMIDVQKEKSVEFTDYLNSIKTAYPKYIHNIIIKKLKEYSL
jgi:hypothetical protein